MISFVGCRWRVDDSRVLMMEMGVGSKKNREHTHWHGFLSSHHLTTSFSFGDEVFTEMAKKRSTPDSQGRVAFQNHASCVMVVVGVACDSM